MRVAEGGASGHAHINRVLAALACALLCVLLLPLAARASLPDNRIYEQVSPADKDGNVVVPTPPFGVEFGIGLAAGDGNAVAYQTSGAVGSDTNQGGIQEVISRHVAGVGWEAEPADTRQQGQLGIVSSAENPGFFTTNENFEDIFFDPTGCCTLGTATYSPEEPSNGLDLKLYLERNPQESPVWIGKPQIAKPIPAPGQAIPNWFVAGTSPEGKMYFDYSGTLLPEDEQPKIKIKNSKGEEEEVPGPESRAPHVGNGTGGNGNYEPTNRDAWGFYEWSNGALSEAGVLPEGKLSPWGAISAALAPTARGNITKNGGGPNVEQQENQVSTNGKRALFVSPDPQVDQEENEIPVLHPETPELYQREELPDGSHRSVLVSRDTLLPPVKKKNSKGVEEEFPAQAPEGVHEIEDGAPGEYGGQWTDAYASPDGSRVFFATPATSPALTKTFVPHSEWGIYVGARVNGHWEMAVTSGGTTDTTAPIPWPATDSEVQAALEALPNVGTGNVTATQYPPYEYTFVFNKETVTNLVLEVTELNPFYSGAGNSTTWNAYEYDVATETLAYRPELDGAKFEGSSQDGSRVLFISHSGNLDLLINEGGTPRVETIASDIQQSTATPVRATANGSVFLFYASPGGSETLKHFNNGGYKQFYRYEVATKDLACVSCPPAGVIATEEPETHGDGARANLDLTPRTTEPVRIMSEDGSRVFFTSPDALVGADLNGKPDAYEWENGHLYLISAGNSTVPSYYIDSSANGNDVFFTTEQGLVPSDKDEQTDVYDARIPRPGDNPPPEQTPCAGEVCQGPPSVPELLTPAASATFEGLGNIPPEKTPETKAKPSLKCTKGFVKKNGRCVRQKAKKKSHTKKKSHKARRSAARGKRRGK